jgi:hypothetical protein
MLLRHAIVLPLVALSMAVIAPCGAAAAEARDPAVESAVTPSAGPDGSPLNPVFGLLGSAPIVGGLLGGPHGG